MKLLGTLWWMVVCGWNVQLEGRIRDGLGGRKKPLVLHPMMMPMAGFVFEGGEGGGGGIAAHIGDEIVGHQSPQGEGGVQTASTATTQTTVARKGKAGGGGGCG